jgi:hypothetical protein
MRLLFSCYLRILKDKRLHISLCHVTFFHVVNTGMFKDVFLAFNFFQKFAAVTLILTKIKILLDVTPCGLVNSYRVVRYSVGTRSHSKLTVFYSLVIFQWGKLRVSFYTLDFHT